MKLRYPSGSARRAQGFTLIELVMVIVIIGILSAVAIPRFFDLGQSARVAAVQGVNGAVNSAMAIAHSAALVNNTASAATATASMDGKTVNLVYGYPDASATGIGLAVNFTPSSTMTAAAGGTAGTWVWTQTGGSGACNVTYTQSTATAPASVALNSGGC